jgi:hypothetical protein
MLRGRHWHLHANVSSFSSILHTAFLQRLQVPAQGTSEGRKRRNCTTHFDASSKGTARCNMTTG